MKAAVIYKAGGPQQLTYQEVPVPVLKPGWSLVKVRGFGINHSELFTREGKSPSVTFPRILGIECVGEIAETTLPEALPVGQTVVSIMGEMGRAFDGSYAEYVLLPNEQIYPVDTTYSWAELAAIPETYYTAYGSMKNLQMQASDRILVRGAASGVGIAFVKLLLAKYPAMRIDGTSRDKTKVEALKAAGFDQIIEDRDGQLQTASRYDKILELIGPATLKNSFAHLNEHGIVCSTGQLGNQWYLEKFDPIIDIRKNSYLTSFYSGNVTSEGLNDLFSYIKEHHVPVKPEKVFLLKDIQAAHQYLEAAGKFGKVVVVTDESDAVDK